MIRDVFADKNDAGAAYLIGKNGQHECKHVMY